jgi:sodium/proline symporter
MTRDGALAGILVGALTVVVWKPLGGGIFELYEILPGFLLSTLAVITVSLAGAQSPAVTAEFDRISQDF